MYGVDDTCLVSGTKSMVNSTPCSGSKSQISSGKSHTTGISLATTFLSSQRSEHHEHLIILPQRHLNLTSRHKTHICTLLEFRKQHNHIQKSALLQSTAH